MARGAFPAFNDPLTPDELAGLACEPEVESRLVMERGGRKPWEVTHGPQDPARLRRLPRSHWTLLVQGVDRWVPGVAAMLEHFRFIPDWRVDDVMVSFAPRRGTVGPHVDSYDVFLVQGKGRRRWGIDARPAGALKPGLDLRILSRFHAQQEWVLNPGDMLYLPPGVSHFGVALEDCLTYSVGFRAPDGLEVLGGALQSLAERGSIPRYRDPGLKPAHPGELPRKAVAELRSLAVRTLDGLGEDGFAALAGRLLTEPKAALPAPAKLLDAASVRRRLAGGAVLARAGGSRLAFLRRDRSADLFFDGRRRVLSPAEAFAAPMLTARRRFPAEALRPFLGRPGFLPLLSAMLQAGTFVWEKGKAGGEE